ncbi:hypothetical protein PBT90_15855 [Algoriphagus halophytocola]|uniref:Uncharacterized protein n=1 Tax=Algoriphagus halophytocola TaxID=2991499 RepID=A0ABY6MEK1_9BACT|nr:MULTISPECIES: hypothetical protein [unclassified Algoriphagus]UZD21046.1 hypothetical protein OM944_10190 [Algoriphagus sp. TR-M5]WBL42212.1 hypothetical protein PBT90_15855 [Algoriphagus sp. TR-M9]
MIVCKRFNWSIFLVFVILIGVSLRTFGENIPLAQPPNEALNTDGLYFAEFYDYIYRGHFEHVEITASSQIFLMIYSKYLRTFGSTCPEQLPENKVEIMDLICVTEEVTTENGMEVSRVCVEYEAVGSGIFADPDMYQTQLKMEKEQAMNILPSTIESMTNPNAIGNSLDMVHKSKGLLSDMAVFFQLNSCASEALRRFEKNLRNYALGNAPDRLDEISKYQQMREAGGPTGPQDLTTFVDHLVADQAETWAFNKYQRGSISGLVVQGKDSQGRPTSIQANYRFSGFMGNSQGWVRVLFKNGLPDCIIFYDFPDNCKTPNSSLVSDYAGGSYSN